MKMLLTLALSALLSLPAVAQTGVKNFIDQNYIEVLGYAELEVAPDEIYLSIALSEKDIKGKTLVEVERAMFERLSELGIDVEKDVAIKDWVSNFQNYWLAKTDINLKKTYQVLVHEAKVAGRVFVGLKELGISAISVEKVSYSKLEDLKLQVKRQAMVAAEKKAQALAGAVKQAVGRAIFIQEEGAIEDSRIQRALQGRVAGIQIRGVPGASGKSSSSYDAYEPAVEFEKIKLESNILVRFELK